MRKRCPKRACRGRTCVVCVWLGGGLGEDDWGVIFVWQAQRLLHIHVNVSPGGDPIGTLWLGNHLQGQLGPGLERYDSWSVILRGPFGLVFKIHKKHKCIAQLREFLFISSRHGQSAPHSYILFSCFLRWSHAKRIGISRFLINFCLGIKPSPTFQPYVRK